MFRALLIAVGILAMHGAAQADVKLTADFVGPGTYSPTTGARSSRLSKKVTRPQILRRIR